jgi:hypothetical protein
LAELGQGLVGRTHSLCSQGLPLHPLHFLAITQA